MQNAVTADKLVLDIVNLGRESTSANDLFMKFVNMLKQNIATDEVLLTDVGNSGFEEYVVNSGKPYVDNRLSDYSAFPELINYYNTGFKSCLILPIVTDSKPLGVTVLLAKREDAFDSGTVSMLSMMSSIVAYQANYKIEKERSISVAKYFDTTFNNIMPQVLVDKNGSVVKANKSMFNLFNASQKEMAGKNVKDFFNIGQEAVQNTKNGLYPGIKSKYHEDKRFDVWTSRINDSLLYMLFYDATEVSYLKERSKLFDNSMHEAFLMLQKNSTVSWASKNIERIIGVSANEIVGRKLIDFVSKKDDLGKQMVEIGDIPYVAQLKLNLGNDVFKDVRLTILRNDFGFACVIESNFEKYLASMQKIVDDLIQLSGDAVISLDDLGYIKSANHNAGRLIDRDFGELVGTQLTTIYADMESQKRLESSIAIARKNGVVADFYVNILGRSNESKPFEQSVRAIVNEDDEVTGYIVISKELSTRRELAENRDKLEQTEKLVERLKSESDLKTQFVYNLSHDLKTPLTNILGYSKILLMQESGKLNTDQVGSVQTIIDEAQRLMMLILQILDVAKLESNKIKLDWQNVDLNKLRENPSISVFEDLARSKGVALTWIIDYNVPEIQADPNRLIQVFVNLLSNAVKFTETGTIDIKVARKNKNVRVEIVDTGIGISKEDKAKLFKRKFLQLKKGLTTQAGQGTGLGLSIVKGIINLHGGRIGIKSELGRGSIFWFTIPISRKQKKPKTNPDVESAKQKEPVPTDKTAAAAG